MKQQQNQNLGFLTSASQACAIEGCDPDFILMSSVVIPAAATLTTADPLLTNLTLAYPGGTGSDGSALWFFQKHSTSFNHLFQSGKEFIQGGNLVSSSTPIAGQLLLESMQVHSIGLQIASSFGNVPVTPKDAKMIADAALFDMWLEADGATPDNPTYSDYPDISVPVVAMPSNVGLYGSTAETGQGIASLGVPGLIFATELKEKPILQKGQLIGARLSFPPQVGILNGIPGAAQSATPPTLQTTSGVLVRLFMFGKAKYKNRS